MSQTADELSKYYSLANISLDPIENMPHKKISLYSAAQEAQVHIVFDSGSRMPNFETSWVSVGPGHTHVPLEKLGPVCIESLNGTSLRAPGSEGYFHYKGGGSLRYQWPEAVFVWGDPDVRPENPDSSPEEPYVKSLNIQY